MSMMTTLYYIPRLRNLVRKVSRDCVTCHRVYAKTFTLPMTELPADRVTPAPPFSNVGIDYAGPILYKLGCVCIYVAVFVFFFVSKPYTLSSYKMSPQRPTCLVFSDLSHVEEFQSWSTLTMTQTLLVPRETLPSSETSSTAEFLPVRMVLTGFLPKKSSDVSPLAVALISEDCGNQLCTAWKPSCARPLEHTFSHLGSLTLF